jgi:hypothetical protein
MVQAIMKCYADAVGCKIENAIECFRVAAVMIVWSEEDQGPKVGKRRKFSTVGKQRSEFAAGETGATVVRR